MPTAAPCRKRIPPLALAWALLLTALPLAAGPVLAPGQRLFVIATEHFDIIFPKRSEPSALRLSRIAEGVYAEVSGKLAAGLPARVPVVVTPDIGVFNGFANPVPYMHIVLYDTPMDPAWTAFRDNFRGLFLHELTHAVSLQVKAPWAAFLSGIFGSWVAPALINAPMFMVEGVTVSLEGGDGGFEGRANDPLVKERLRQDIVENRFKSPLEAEGVYDGYPGGSIHYEYGGLFNAYLQRTYGMDAYAGLWKAMGGLIWSASLDPYKSGFFAAFERVYGIAFTEAWAGFRMSLETPGVADPPERLTPSALSVIGGLAAGGGRLFWVDTKAGRAFAMDCATGRRETLFVSGPGTSITDASPDGGRLLVSRKLATSDGRSRVETATFDTAARRFVPGGALPDLREARFFRGGLVGLVSNLHNADLVLAEAGGTRVLLAGSEGLMFSSPAVLDDGRIALVVTIEGRRTIGVLGVDSGELRLARILGEGPLGGENGGLLDGVRQISASGGRILFNHDSDDRMYKLGVLDPESGAVELDTTDYSGGVFWPRESGGRVYYVGRFSDGTALCRHPAVGMGLGGRALGAAFETFDPLAGTDAAATGLAPSLPSIRSYNPLAYAKPMWLPYPDLNTVGRSTRVFGLFYFQDPIESNTVLLNAGYDTGFPFADTFLTWTNTVLPVQISLSVGDTLAYGASGPPQRQTLGQARASLSLPLWPYPRQVLLGLGGSVLARAYGTGGSPYSWPVGAPSVAASAQAGWLGRIPGASTDATRGIDLVSYHDLDIRTQTYKTEAKLVLATDTLPLRLDLWGAWANAGILSLDSTGPVFATDHRPAYAEYQTLRTGAAPMLAEGNGWCRVVDQSVGSSVLGLYVQRLILDAGLRGAYFKEEFLSSCYARVSLDLAVGVGALGGLGLRAFAEGFARLSETNGARILGWRLGIQTNAEAGPAARKGTE